MMLGSGPSPDNQHGYAPTTAYGSYGSYMQPPPGNSNKTAMWAHLGMLLTWAGGLIFFPLALLAFIVPMILRSSYRHEKFVRHHATQALNCALTDLLIAVGAILLIILGIFINLGVEATIVIGIPALVNAVTRIVYAIIAASKAYSGQQFRYPIWISFRLFSDDTIFATAKVPSTSVAHD